MSITSQFQSTLPVWGGTLRVGAVGDSCQFQSTLPVWGGTPHRSMLVLHRTVSIHPPRVGRDTLRRVAILYPHSVSIHPPRVGRDSRGCRGGRRSWGFNPPSPCGEGPGSKISKQKGRCFNPPSPCGEGQATGGHRPQHGRFNPPSPCGEGPKKAGFFWVTLWFQSTLPVWGGTGGQTPVCVSIEVSIHPPRVGRDPHAAITIFKKC